MSSSDLSIPDLRREIAEAILAIGAVGFRPANPIVFKSGIHSPVYCDNRKFPFHPAEWSKVVCGFERMLAEQGTSVDVIGGVEAAGIPHSAALGFLMQKPSIFIRKEAKAHGTKKRVEGGDVSGLRVVLVEDLVTTGMSSLAAIEALRDEGAIVEDCLAIISYGFAEAVEAFEKAGVRLSAATDFETVLAVALELKSIDEPGSEVVSDWLRDPHGWAARQGVQAR